MSEPEQPDEILTEDENGNFCACVEAFNLMRLSGLKISRLVRCFQNWWCLEDETEFKLELCLG